MSNPLGTIRWLTGQPWAAAMRLRRAAYRHGLLRSESLPCPVLCVGNLTTGGTGKTPMVAWLVEHLKAMGRQPAILTRGYKAVAGRSDEAALLEALTAVPVVVNADRVAGGREAIENGADVLVMDDGFQHRRLRRDLDIVLVDATDPFGRGGCLPLGRLREGLSALADAGVVVLTRGNAIPDPRREELCRTLLDAGAPLVATAEHHPIALIDPDGTRHANGTLVGRTVFAFAGVGNPQAFFATLRRMGLHVVGCETRPDHVHYTPAMCEDITCRARRAGADVLITTTKDGVKLRPDDFDLDLWQVAIAMRLTRGEQELLAKVSAVL